MNEKIALIHILPKCNGNQGMLHTILNKHPGLEISSTLANEIIAGELNKPEIFRKINDGIGRKKPHDGKNLIRREGKLKNS